MNYSKERKNQRRWQIRLCNRRPDSNQLEKENHW